MRRFPIEPKQLDGHRFRFHGSQAHHLCHVLRITPGETIELFDGQGRRYLARIDDIQGHSVFGTILETMFCQNDPAQALSLTLAMGICRPKTMDTIVQKANELGVAMLMPVHCRFSSHSVTPARLRRWQRIILESCKQCRRDTGLAIASPIDFSNLPFEQFSLRLICWEDEKETILHPSLLTSHGPILLLIGPEGGFHQQEIDLARRKGCRFLSLGPLILRAETAAISAAAIVHHCWRLALASSPSCSFPTDDGPANTHSP